MSKKRKIYTGNGDNGMTKSLSGNMLYKDDIIFEVLGTIDEVAANICIVKNLGDMDLTCFYLMGEILSQLNKISAEIASNNTVVSEEESEMYVKFIESYINMMHKISNVQEFVYPGRNKADNYMNLTRTVIRRAERRIATLHRSELLPNKKILVYFNRLSDLFFVLGNLKGDKDE